MESLPIVEWMPRDNTLTLDDTEFRCAMGRRLYMPVSPLADTCSRCNRPLDAYGFHRTTCMRTGLVHARHKYLVSTWRQIFKECGINIPQRNVERHIRDTHLRGNPDDLRRLDLIVPGIPGVFNGQPLFIDATCVSPVHGNGTPMHQADVHNGICLTRKDRETREVDYPDVHEAPHAQLLSLSVETYGRWGPDSLRLIRELAMYKASYVPDALKASVSHAYSKRWWSLLNVALHKCIAGAILRQEGGDLLEASETLVPMSLDEVLDTHR